MTRTSRPTCAPNGESGFTLLELLVGLLITSIVIGLCAWTLRLVGAALSRGNAFTSTQDMVLRGAGTFRRDVERMQWIVQGAGGRGQFAFIGEADRLVFVAAEPPYPTEPGLFVIDYSFTRQGLDLVLLRSRGLFDPAARSIGEQAMAEPALIFEGRFQYRFSYARPDFTGWEPTWTLPRRLPAMIRLEVIDEGSGGQVMPAIVVQPRISAERGCTGPTAATCSVHSKGEIQPLPESLPPGRPAAGNPDDRPFNHRGR